MKKIIIWLCEKLNITGYVAKIIVKPENKTIFEARTLTEDADWHRVSFNYKWSGEKELFVDGAKETK